MKHDLISIVVPVYNVENLLERCVDSILGQTYKFFELILVDDGSTDNSLIICETYKKKDSRISVIHKPNGGLSDARNAGIGVANGKYITFIDSDDYVAEDYLEFLYRLLKKYSADISGCLGEKFTGERVKKKNLNVIKKTYLFDGQEATINACYQKKISHSAWGKLYKIELFKKVKYPLGRLYEDLGTTYKLFLLSKTIVFSLERKYYYYQREDSIMHYNFSLKNMDRIYMSERLYKDVYNISKQMRRAAVSRIFISNVQVLRELPIGDESYAKQENRIKRNIERYRGIVFRDKNAKLINRFIALAMYFDLRKVQKLGTVYKFFYK